MSDSPAREPCFHCSESSAISARLCPHCKQSLLVDVVLHEPLRDPRAAYALARALSRLESVSRPVVELKRALATPRTELADGVTREQARRVVEICGGGGVTARTEPHRERRTIRLPAMPVPALILAVAALALAALAVAWLVTLRRDAGDPKGASGEPQAAIRTLTTAQIAQTAGPSTVSLSCGNRIGSGFFVAPETLVTNAHVVCENDPVVEVHFQGGRQITGRVTQRDTKLDLALVEVPYANAAPLPFGDASLLEPGEKVVIIGTPHGMDHTVHEGIVSHVGRNLFGVAYVQVDANVNPGNSGGPLFNASGQLVGIVTLKAQGASGIGFALPINYVYDGPTALLRAGHASSEAWQDLLTRAHAQELEERDRAATAFSKPALVSASLQASELFVIVLKRSATHPGMRRLTVSFERGSITLCVGTIEVRQWLTLEDVAQRTAPSQLPVDIRWLREHDLTDDLWYGAGTLGRDPCSRHSLLGTDVVADDAEPGYERVTVSQ